MRTAALKSYVDECLARDGARDHFDKRVKDMAAEGADAPAGRDADALAQLAQDYVYAVVGMLSECESAAEERDARRLVEPLIRTAVRYFEDPEDLIPDEHGLYGLMDDAYLAHRFIIELSGRVEKMRGFPLVPSVQDEHLAYIRAIVGDEIATRLDERVARSIQSVEVRNQMAQLSMLSGTLPTHDSALWNKVKADRARIAWKPKG